jgi:3-deoxy-D-manno-octulosonic-acid transferase
MLRSSQSFSSYNFREYFVRRTKDSFRSMQNETDPERLRSLYAEAIKESTVLKRSSIVNQLYGGWKLAIEVQDTESDPSVVKQRSDS